MATNNQTKIAFKKAKQAADKSIGTKILVATEPFLEAMLQELIASLMKKLLNKKPNIKAGD